MKPSYTLLVVVDPAECVHRVGERPSHGARRSHSDVLHGYRVDTDRAGWSGLSRRVGIHRNIVHSH